MYRCMTAGCLHADYVAADQNSTLEHGNLVRGVWCSGCSPRPLHSLSDHTERMCTFITRDFAQQLLIRLALCTKCALALRRLSCG